MIINKNQDYAARQERNRERLLPLICLISASFLLLAGLLLSYLFCFFFGPLGVFTIPPALLLGAFPLLFRRTKLTWRYCGITAGVSAFAWVLQVFVVAGVTSNDFWEAAGILNDILFLRF